MKTIYTINVTDHTSSNSISPEFNSEAEARIFFENEKSKLANTEPADVSEWQDHDLAWKQVYQLELTKTTIDEDGDVDDIVAIESTDYYYR